MLAQLIGIFDFGSAAVVLFLVGGPSIVAMVYLVRKPNKTELMKANTDRELAILNAHNVHERETKKLEQNLITSHSRANDE